MKTIYKYELYLTDNITEITVPQECEILDVQQQGSKIVMWCLINKLTLDTKRRFKVYGTGDTIPMNLNGGNYIGTVQGKLNYVWHVFEVTYCGAI